MLLDKLKKIRLYIILILVISIFLGILIAIKVSNKEYISESTVLLVKTEKISENEKISLGNLELSNNLIATFEEVLKSDSSIEEVKNKLNIMDNRNFARDIDIKKDNSADTLKITVKNLEEKNAIEFNEKLLEIFSTKLVELYTDAELYIVDEPHIIAHKYNNTIIIIPIISFVIGFFINCIYIVISVIIDKNTKINLNIEKEINLKKLIDIPLNIENKNELIHYESEKNLTIKAFKELRSNIQFINVNNNDKNIIFVTSPVGKEGKSYVSANIAISFAETGKKVILIDSDMMTGRQSKIFNIPNNLGFSNYLSSLDENGLEIKKITTNFINETQIKNLNIITSGTIPPNPSELLVTERLEELIKDLTVFYDVIVIDGTSILNSIEALILSRFATSTILISNYKKSKREDILKSKKDIQNVGGRPIGIIINKVKIKKTKKEIKEDLKIKLEKCKNKFSNLIKEIKLKVNKLNQKLLTESTVDYKKDKILENPVKDIVITDSKPKEMERNKIANSIELKNNFNQDKKIEEKLESREIKNEKDNSKNEISIEKNNEDDKKEEKLLDDKTSKERKIKDETLVKNEKTQDNEKIDNKKQETENSINTEKVIEDTENKKENVKKENIIILKFNDLKKSYGEFIQDTKPLAVEKINNTKTLFKEKITNIKTKLDNQISKKEVEIEKNDSIIFSEKVKKEDAKQENKEDIIKNNGKKEIKPEKMETKSNSENEEATYKGKSEDAVLIVIDAEKAYCRVFSKYCFTEKTIRGIDKNDGFAKDQYATNLVKIKKEKIAQLYSLDKKQLKRVDPLIYTTLMDYDECVWIERKRISNTAEVYIKCITKEYEKLPEENDEEYETRCKRLRKKELGEADIEIEYKLDGMWKNKILSLVDKIAINSYSKYYEINDKFKNNMEIKKSLENKLFYNDIIQKAETELEKINQENNKLISNEIVDDEFERLKEEMKIAEQERERKKEEIKTNERKKQNHRKMRKGQYKQKEDYKKSKEDREKKELHIAEELFEDNLYPKTKNNKNI